MLEAEYVEHEIYWRPPDGRQLLFKGSSELGTGLLLVTVDDGSVEHLQTSPVDAGDLRPLGWSPDGRRVAFQGTKTWGPYRAVMLDIATMSETPLDATFGHISNEGSMVVGFSTVTEGPQVCIRLIDGDTCTHIGGTSQAPEYTTNAALQWSPDDRWITTFNASSRLVWLLSSDATEADVSISADGPASWQRRAVSREFASP
jgi:Tol biopolymer transport system component